ncbi:MAG TPA: FliH/SctL family protein [Terriglobales bacterium]|nr:FliH/SctL family protein [Terriglobales bacterium]
MSSSYKSFFPPSAPAPVENFAYPEIAGAHPDDAADSDTSAEGDEVTQLLLRAHAEGVREGEEKERARGAVQLAEERVRITQAILRFKSEVADYYSRTELEVVQLALAIASKILQREAEADPLLTPKLARGVLEKLHQSTGVRVRVHPAEAEMWQNELAPHREGKAALEVLADEAVAAGNCILETELGRTEIGLSEQFKEIENGLFDLLALKPESE